MITDKKPEKTENLSVRVPKKLRKKIDAIAYQSDRSRNWVINDAISQYLDVQDWQIKLIRQRLAEAESPDAVFIPHEQVKADINKLLKRKRR